MIVSTSVVTVNDVLLTPRGYLQPITGANAVTPKKWNHVVIQYLGSGLNTLASYRIYVNGVSLTLTNAGGGGGSYNRNYIGRQNHTSFFYKGGIDDLRVYNRTLSDGEILQLYKQGR